MKNLIAPEIEAYAEAHSIPESEVCRRLRAETFRAMDFPQMVVGPLEGAFLKMMTHVVDAKRVLEIGTFTGYSALCFAEALSDDGEVITCDIDPESTAFAQNYWDQSPVGGKITAHVAPALETLGQLDGLFDVIFIDADKINYVNYYQRGVELLAPKGVMLIDNVLWNGDVIKNPPLDDSTTAIQELNRVVASDNRVTSVLVTIRDGVMVVRRTQTL